MGFACQLAWEEEDADDERAEKNLVILQHDLRSGWATDGATIFDVIFDQGIQTTGQVGSGKLKHLWPNETKG